MRWTTPTALTVGFLAGAAAAFTLVALADRDDFDRSADQTIRTFAEQGAG